MKDKKIPGWGTIHYGFKTYAEFDKWHEDLDTNGPCPNDNCDYCGTWFMGEDW